MVMCWEIFTRRARQQAADRGRARPAVARPSSRHTPRAQLTNASARSGERIATQSCSATWPTASLAQRQIRIRRRRNDNRLRVMRKRVISDITAVAHHRGRVFFLFEGVSKKYDWKRETPARAAPIATNFTASCDNGPPSAASWIARDTPTQALQTKRLHQTSAASGVISGRRSMPPLAGGLSHMCCAARVHAGGIRLSPV